MLGVLLAVPTFPEGFLEIVSRAELTRDQVVILHPDDLHTLRMFVQRDGLDPSFSVRPTICGARVVSDGSHPRGFATILDGRNRPDLILNYREAVARAASPKPPAPEPPKPRSLWQLLDEADE